MGRHSARARQVLRGLVPRDGITLPWENFSDPETDRQVALEGARFQVVERDAVNELNAAGLPIESTADLLADIDYRAQVPILVGWLGRTDNSMLNEILVRALSVPWASPAATDALLAEFRIPRSQNYRWAVGNALYELRLGESRADDLIEIALDRRYGTARQMVVEAVGRTRSPRALEPLVQLLDDDDVAGHATAGLRRLGTPETRPHLERMLNEPRDWVQAEARAGLRALDRKETAGGQ